MKQLARAELGLEGLSIGDAFGQMFFGKPDLMSINLIDKKCLLLFSIEFPTAILKVGLKERVNCHSIINYPHHSIKSIIIC
jgi:hypothetical protein